MAASANTTAIRKEKSNPKDSEKNLLLERKDSYGTAFIHNDKAKEMETNPALDSSSSLLFNPLESASAYSQLFFNWVSPLLKVGSQRQLNPEDVWQLSDSMKCGYCTNLLIKQWEIADDATPSLVKAMLGSYGWTYSKVGVFLFLAYACDLFGPLVLQRVVNIIQHQGDTSLIWKWLGALLLSRIIKSICLAHFYFQTSAIMLQFVASLKGFVYQKSLRLSSKSRAEKSTADVVNIYTTDVQNIIQAALYFHYLWVLPVEILIALYMLYSSVGNATFAGFATIVVILSMNNFIARYQAKLFEQIMAAKDNRMKVVKEIFGAMQIVKLNAWDARFRDKLARVRTKEVAIIWKYMRLVAFNIFLLWGAPVFVSTITFSVFALWMQETLTADKVFTALALFRLLQEPLRSLPNYITGIIQAAISVKRIQDFATLEERDPSAISTLADPLVSSKYRSAPTVVAAIENGSFAWDSKAGTTPVFQNINMVVHDGEFVVVHGLVGSGKSSFCSILLGDMVKTTGTVFMNGQVAYCPQQAWIQHLTVRNNILFGLPYNKRKYDKVVEACGLKKDLEDLKFGDETEIGEKGLNISGGQKARISLARACYSDADIFIFDSPLAAVDAIVQNQIFTNCLLGLLRHKTRILITHNPDIVSSKHVDRCIKLGPGEFNNVANPSKIIQQPDFPVHISPLIGKRQYQSMKHENHHPQGRRDESNDHETRKSIDIGMSLDISNDTFSPLIKRASSFKPACGSFSEQVNDGSKLVQDEARQEGRVSTQVYLAYFHAIGGLRICAFLILVQVVWQVLQISSDFWLSHWTSESGREQASGIRMNLGIYAALSLGSAMMVFVRTMTISKRGLCGAVKLFDSMTDALMQAPMHFFDANPLGRQLNRYSDDVSNVDLRLPFAYGSVLAIFFSIAATLLTAAIVTQYLGIVMIPMIAMYAWVGWYYLKTARELSRLLKVSQSPVLCHVSASVDGAQVIRAFGMRHERRFILENERLVDVNHQHQFATFAVNEWFAMRMQLMGGAILFVITASLVLLRNILSPGAVGLAFNYGLAVDQGLESLIQCWSWLETSMVSPERIQEYIDIPKEARQIIPETLPLEDENIKWPPYGQVAFEHVSFRYTTGGALVLKNLNFTFAPGEKVGVVGRTGAGKSSLTLALFRINEICAGTIRIDGLDISTLGLRTLRSRLSIITQSPVLFKGSLRSYLDPFDLVNDATLWSCLRKVNIGDKISHLEGKLDTALEENGENFSVGERQMLCMARALLSESKVVVMDEATASIDQTTDALIQKTIRSEFKNSTVITIAHRLDTVMDADRIMVLDHGEIMQLDTPEKLIKQGRGHFYDLAKEGGYLDRVTF